MVEQFGFAMMPLCFAISSGLISGMTSGTSGSMRKVEELSMTTAPRLAASGASVLLMLPPAKRATSMFSKDSGLASSTVYSLPQTMSFLPALRLEARSFREANWKFLSSNRRINSCPTAPVAPRTATRGSLLIVKHLIPNNFQVHKQSL